VQQEFTKNPFDKGDVIKLEVFWRFCLQLPDSGDLELPKAASRSRSKDRSLRQLLQWFGGWASAMDSRPPLSGKGSMSSRSRSSWSGRSAGCNRGCQVNPTLVGAAEGCDLLILLFKIKIKGSQPSAAPTVVIRDCAQYLIFERDEW